MSTLYIWKNRLRKFIDHPPALVPFVKKYLYYNQVADSYIDHYKDVRFLNYDETVNEILNNNKSIVRFGDEVFDMLLGVGLYFDNWHQTYHPLLAERLKEVLSSDHPDLLVCFNPEFILKTKAGFEAEGIGEQHHFWTNSKIYLKDYINKDQVYGSALTFHGRYNKGLPYDNLIDHLKTKNLVIVASNTARFQDQQLGLKTFYVEGPSSDAWLQYDQLMKEVRNVVSTLPKADTLIMTSLGPTSKVMTLDLVREGYTVWDTGQFFDLALSRIKGG
ncbi:MAG: GT-D fold domain-containing glycosyltransferase [Candidatus Paceibacterota bacterium]